MEDTKKKYPRLNFMFQANIEDEGQEYSCLVRKIEDKDKFIMVFDWLPKL